MRKFLFLGVVMVMSSFLLEAQINVPASTVVTETFNSLGSSGSASLSANWKMSSAGTGATSGWTTGTNVAAVTQAANSGTPTVGGRYNWGTNAGIDRSIGFMTDVSYASPNSIMAYYRNSTGSTITTITLSYNVERYRVNADLFFMSFYSSTDGSSWTTRTSGDISSAVFATGTSSYNFSSPQTITKSFTITGLSIPNNGDFYFRWLFNTGANSQGIGLDDVTVSAGNGIPSISATLEDQLSVDVNSNGQANEGDGLRYKAVIKNFGTDTARNVTYNNPTPTNTTLVGASVKTSALANDDYFSTAYNTVLSNGSVLTNDFGVPSVTVASFGTTANASANNAGTSGTTDNGGTITLNSSGTFSYTPPPGFSGNDRFAYIATTLPGGTLPNNDAIVTIAVGIAATATGDNYSAIGNVSLNPNAALGVLTNDIGSNKTVIAVNGDPTKVGIVTTTTQGGNVTLNSDGSFSYNPPAGYEGLDTYSYTIDNGFSSPSTVTVNITVSGMIWFINNGGAVGDGRLSSPFNSVSAFQAVNNGAGNNPAVNDYIFVYENASSYSTSSITLLQNQKLIGQDASLSLATITGFTVPSYSTALPIMNTAGNPANLSNTGSIVTLSTSGGNLIQGLTLSTSAGTAVLLSGTATGNNTATDLIISVSGTANAVSLSTTSYNGTFNYTSGSIANIGTGTAFLVSGSTANISCSVSITQSGNGTLVGITNHSVGTITFQTGTLSATNGNGLQFTNADGSYNFNGTNTLNGGDAGIDILNGSAGTFSFSANTNITSPTGNAFNIDGTISTVTANITYNGSITQNTASQRLININTTGSGTITFQAGTLTGGANSTGVNIIAANGNVSFSNGLILGTAGARMTNQAITITGGVGTYSLGALSVFTTSSTGLVATNADGTIGCTSGTIDASSAAAVSISGPGGLTTLAIVLNTVNSTGGINNISLTNCNGSIALGTGALSSASGTSFNVSGGSAAISYNGTISQTTAQKVVNIASATGGTISFFGALSGTTSSTGITLATNTGATINFTGGITLNGTASIFSATGGGTVGVTGTTNTIGNTTAPTTTALTITNTTIGAGGVTFQKISCVGGVNGINLNTTGSGSFTVTGDGASDASNTTRGRTTAKSGGGTIALGSGGTISGTTGTAILTTSTGPITLRNMVIQNGSTEGVSATTASAFIIDNTLITGFPNSYGFHPTSTSAISILHSEIGNSATTVASGSSSLYNIKFDEVTGTCSMQNSLFQVSYAFVIRIGNSSGTLSLSMTNCTVSGTTNGIGVGIYPVGSSNVTTSFQGSTISGNSARGIQLGTGTTTAATAATTINNCIFTNNYVAIDIAHGSSGTNTFTVTNNNCQTNVLSSAQAININRLGSSSFSNFGVFSGTISGNTIGTAGVANSGSDAGSGIQVESNGNGGITRVAILNNTIREYGTHGIYLAAVDASTGATLEARVQGNNIANGESISLDGINVTLGALNTDHVTICLNITGNTVTNAIRNGIRVRASGLPSAPTTLLLNGWDGVTAVTTYFANNNPSATGAVANITFSNTTGTTSSGTCTTP